MIMSGTIGYFVVQSGAPPLLVVFWRCLLGAGTLLVLVMARSDSRAALRRVVTSRVGLWVALSGALLVGNWTLIFTAYSYLSIGMATVVFHVEPFLLIGLSALLLRERIPGRTWAWIGLGFAGIALVAEPWRTAGGGLGRTAVGVGLTLGAATLYAASIILVRRIQALSERPPGALVITTIQLLTGALLSGPALLLVKHEITTSGWLHLVVLGVVNTGLMYWAIYSAYPHLSTATIGVLSFVYPAAAVIVDLVAYGVVITLAQMGGFAAIAAAGIGHALTADRNARG